MKEVTLTLLNSLLGDFERTKAKLKIFLVVLVMVLPFTGVSQVIGSIDKLEQ